MSEKEMRRAAVLGRVKARELSLKETVESLGLSYRQVKRWWPSDSKVRSSSENARGRP